MPPILAWIFIDTKGQPVTQKSLTVTTVLVKTTLRVEFGTLETLSDDGLRGQLQQADYR
jgi:hypothetical protein